ncbi:uncharacterized protein [Littorina saxatilis]|uniref:uncharacterized protein n=1 Tax=Littorina saxatilis TaxID=31220 RepID=UPI0038B5741A
MNALLNDGKGIAVLHLQNPYKLADFDEQVDEVMDKMIPDSTLLKDNFTRHFFDNIHVIFSVVERDRSLISTLHLHTKVPWNWSIRDIRHDQMLNLVRQRASDEPSESCKTLQLYQFDLGKEFRIPGTVGVFVESFGLQAKSVPKNNPNFPNPVVWISALEGGRLAEYISAFTQLATGGSVFFGVAEEKVPNSEDKTGKYVCEGVLLRGRNTKEALRAAIENTVKQEMLWLSHLAPRKPITIIFHTINGNPDLYIIEVFVPYFHGIAFYNKEGPQAYRTDRTNQRELIPLERWTEKYRGTLSRQEGPDVVIF